MNAKDVRIGRWVKVRIDGVLRAVIIDKIRHSNLVDIRTADNDVRTLTVEELVDDPAPFE